MSKSNRSISLHFDDGGCLNPSDLYIGALRLGLPYDHWWGKPNSFYLPRGREHGQGWILISREDADELNLYTPHTLSFIEEWIIGVGEEPVGEELIGYSSEGQLVTRKVALTNLYVLSVHAIYSDNHTPAGTTPCLVELVDVRYLFRNSAINKTYDNDEVWKDIFSDLWNNLPTVAGSVPTLPEYESVIGKLLDVAPGNVSYHGVNVWDAICNILAKVCYEIVYNPVSNSFSVVDLAATQDYEVDTEGTESFNEDKDIQDTNDAFNEVPRHPKTIRVSFFPGEYYKDVASGLSEVIDTETLMVVPGDLDSRYNTTTELDNRAADIAAQWSATFVLDGIQHQTTLIKRFAGFHPEYMPGEQLYSIHWGDVGDSLGAWTEYQGRYPRPLEIVSDIEITSFFEMLTDVEGNAHLGLANPVELDPNTFTRSDPYSGVISSAHTVVVSDSSPQMGFWIGDLVRATQTGRTIEIDEYEGSFPVYEITNRLSSQQQYLAILTEELVYQGEAEMTVTINNSERTTKLLLLKPDTVYLLDDTQPFTIWDFLLQSEQTMGIGTPVNANYYSSERLWRVTAAPCYPP